MAKTKHPPTELRSIRLVRSALAELAQTGTYPSNKAIFEATRRLDPENRGVPSDAYKKSRNRRVYELIAKARGKAEPVPTPWFELSTVKALKPGRDLQRVFSRYRTFSKYVLAQRLVAAEEALTSLRRQQAKRDLKNLELLLAPDKIDALQKKLDEYEDIFNRIQVFIDNDNK